MSIMGFDLIETLGLWGLMGSIGGTSQFEWKNSFRSEI